jgi:hypothetical protein
MFWLGRAAPKSLIVVQTFPPAAPPKLSARKDKIRIDFVSKKKRKNFKELLDFRELTLS